MKKITLLLLFSFINSLYSQELPVSLRSGDFILERNLDLNFTSDDPYRMLHFEVLPTEDQKLYLNTLGVEFLYYLPKNIFVVALSQEINQNILQEYNVISVNKILVTSQLINQNQI